MAELKMEVILKAFDHVTATLRGIDGTIGKTKQNISDYKKRIRELSTGIPLNGPLTRQQQRDQQEIIRTTQLIERQQKRLKDLYKMQAHRNSGKEMMGAGAMQMAAATAMGYGASRLMGEGAEFEETMSKVQALTRLQKDSPVLLQLQQQAEMLGETTWATAKQAAEGQAFYAMAGFTPEQIMKSMAGTLDLAKAGNVDIGVAADIGSNILSAFGLNADEMNRVGDILVGTFTRTNTDLEMLGQTMKYVGPIAKGLGVSLEEASAMAGVLGNVGIQADQAGTAMRSIYNRLAAGPSMARKELAKLNVNTKDKDGNLRKPLELFAEILEKTAKMGNAERMGILKSIAGVEAGAAFASVIDKGSITDINRIIDELKKNHGEAAAVAKTMSDNTLGDIERLSSAWSGFKLKIFQVNSEGLHKTLVFLTKIMTNISGFAKQNPEILRDLSLVAAGIMGITASLGLAKLAWGAFQFAVLGNPMLAALGLAVILGWQIHQNFDAIMELWNDSKAFRAIASIAAIATSLGLIWGFATKLKALVIGSALLKTAGALSATSLSLTGAVAGIKAIGVALLASPFVAITLLATSIYMVYDNWESLVWFFHEGIHNIGSDLQKLYSWMGNWIGQIPLVGSELQLVFDIGANVILGIGTAFRKVGEGIGAGIALVIGAFRNWDTAFSVLKDRVAEFWNDMVKWAQPAIDKIMKILQPFLDAYYAIVGKTNTELASDMYKNAQIEERYGVSVNDYYSKTPDEQAAMLHGRAESNLSVEDQRAEVIQMMTGGNTSQVSNTQTNTFQIHITAPDGNAQSIAQAVQRGIASVTKKNSALLGDLR